MDWERTKTILIATFIFLNCILGYQWWSSDVNQTQLVAYESVIKEELQVLLKTKNIIVNGDIPEEVPQLSEIVVKINESLSSTEIQKLQDPLSMTVILSKSIRGDTDKATQIPKLKDYRYDPITSKPETFILNQLNQDYPMFDISVKLFEQEGLITKYIQSYVEVQPIENENTQKVIPAYIVIRSLAENYLENDSVIENIELGFHGQMYNSQTQYMVPTWRVVMQNGDIYFIHAFNGSIELPELKSINNTVK